ncbi:MAG TPA: RsmG family class I SAM-dependent methyltransferase [Candidatus Dormibacteraeota bacterium]|nr:RsmG family class I SAM-dependent methyltransferase [Candidatus Dormibacteraeota bacterium]
MSIPRYQPGENERRSLESYLDLLYSESSRVNLTRVPREQAWTRHIEESLALVPLRRWSAGERVLDLGSGAGIPGIPLAITQPAVSVGLIERDRSKAAFLSRCVETLGLSAVGVLGQDALELARSKGFAAADVLVSRAAVPPQDLFRTAGRLLRTGGEGLVHVGGAVSLDADLALAARRAGVGDLRLETSGRSRILRFRRLPG